MNKKKKAFLRKGARVRVADTTLEGAERWHNARLGTVVDSTNETSLVKVTLDGDPRPRFVEWSAVDVEQKPRHGQVDLPIASIRPSRWQHRRRWDPASLQELAQSIQEVGLINRLLVFADENGQHYELIAGERRLRALSALALVKAGDAVNLDLAIEMVTPADWYQIAGLLDNLPGTVPCELRAGVAADFREIVIVENLQRENCSAIEEAEAFHTLIEEEHYTHASLAKRLGKSRAYITQRLGLLGLVESVRDSVDEQAISFTAARSIATLPEDVQPAVTAHVQELAAREGDSQATTRKVQAMARQINTFLDPETWTPPDGEVVSPSVRNQLRLVRHVLRTLDRDRRGEAVISLRGAQNTWGYGTVRNLIGKQPLTLVRDRVDLATVLRQLTGRPDPTTAEFWAEAAQANHWRCVDCRFWAYPLPETATDKAHCERWNGADVDTCLGFIGHMDPLVIPLSYHFSGWAEKLGIPAQENTSRGDYGHLDDVDTYRDLVERAARAAQEQESQREMEKTQAHLPALRSYCGAQAEQALTGLPWGFGHAQAHRCDLCVNYRSELTDQDLPPCRFSVKPFENRFDGTTVAPGMGALVSQEGLLVPRCVEFRHREVPQVLPLAGFRFPSTKDGRAAVLHWLRTIAGRGSSENVHNYTLAGPLAWLPYPRDRGTDLDALIRYVRDAWQDLGGDEVVARLISVALTEATAGASYSNQFDLMNPLTGRADTWASVNWQSIRDGQRPYGLPKDWYASWVSEAHEETGG